MAGVITPCLLPGLISAVAIDVESPVTIGLMDWRRIGRGCWWPPFVSDIRCMLLRAGRPQCRRDRVPFTVSRQITAGNRLVIFVDLYLGGVIRDDRGFCALCLPFFFALGFSILMLAVAYLAMAGQPTAADVAPLASGPLEAGSTAQPGISE